MNAADFAVPVRGPSYSLAMRAGATVAIALVLLYVLRWWDVIAAGGWSSPAAIVFVAAFCGMVGSYGFMLKSVTVVDSNGIRQTGLMEKNVAWDQVRNARVARWGATRLIVRGERGPFTVFFGGNDALRAAFLRVAVAYPR